MTAETIRLGNARLGDRLVDVSIERGLIAGIADASGAADIDLGGRWVSPGLWDHHVHFTQWTLTSQRVDLTGARSAREAAELMRDAVAAGKADAGILIGGRFRDGMWPDAPSLDVLDEATGGIPAVLVSLDLHATWLNTAALERFGFTGHPNGMLVEDDAFEVERRIAELPDETVDAWARQTAAQAAARGVVGIVELEMTWNRSVWERRVAAGHDKLRVRLGAYREHLDRAVAEGQRTGSQLGDLLEGGPFKILTDGSLGTRTAFMSQEYPGHGGHGMLVVNRDHLVPLMRQAWAGGIEPTVHAIGDAANTLALDAFEEVGCRGSIEHAQLLHAADVPRFGALGVEVSVQPEHAMDDRELAARYWPGRTGDAYAFRSLLDTGATLRFGSDAPVSPLDPWLGIAAAVTRERDGHEPWHPEQRVSRAEALQGSTRSTIDVGQRADLVVTELDPLSATGEQLRGMPVAATLLGGRFTYNAL